MITYQHATSEFRNVTINNLVAQIPTPIDAYFAMMAFVESQEGLYYRVPSKVPDLTGASVVRTGRRNDIIHVFTVTSVMATGVYSIEYVESKDNAVSQTV